jgi:DNA-binding LacI/PurR family transcriptional regulator
MGGTETGRRRRPTLDDVAALAKVSRMVASRAIRGEGSVSTDASARVHEAVTMLGYVVHQGARSLATNKTGAVAFLAPMRNQRFFSDPNVAEILSGINSVVRSADLQLVTLTVEDEEDAKRAGSYARGRHVDGVMILSPELVGDLVRQLATAGVPMSANGRVDGAAALDSIVLDTEERARDMAAILRADGVRRCAIIAGPVENPTTAEFIRGIEREFGATDGTFIAHGDHSYQEGAAAMEELLLRQPELDGVAAASDMMASAALAVLSARGRRVPDDVRVTGWDNSLPPEATDPALTTLSVPYESIGEQMARLLLEQLDGGSGGRVVAAPSEIIRRASA